MRFRILFTFVLASSIALPFVAYAGIPFFGPIVPSDLNRCAGGWGGVMTVINNLIEFLITLVIVFVAPIMIAYSGFLFVVNPVNPSGKEKAKGILLNTIAGLVIALCGWLIVDAIMAVLYHPTDPGLAGKAWSQLVTSGGEPFCLIQEESLQQLNQALITGSSATGVVSVVPPSTAPASETAIRQQLASAGVQINHSAPCNPYNLNGVTNGCTNVGNIQPATVAQVIALKNACNGCVVKVTGGSEAGHASGALSHGTGYKVDLGLNSVLDAYIKSMTSVGTRTGDSPGPAYTDKCGQNQYVQESDHWDITVSSSCVPLK